MISNDPNVAILRSLEKRHSLACICFQIFRLFGNPMTKIKISGGNFLYIQVTKLIVLLWDLGKIDLEMDHFNNY